MRHPVPATAFSFLLSSRRCFVHYHQRVSNFLRTARLFLWSLWFGGVCALLVFVTRLFASSRDVGLIAAPVLFHVFAFYQLILGTLAAGISLATLTRKPSRADRTASALLVIALFAAFGAAAMTGRIEHLQATGQVQTPEFRRAHAVSGAVYLIETASLLAAGIMAMRSLSAPANTSATTEPVKRFPAGPADPVAAVR